MKEKHYQYGVDDGSVIGIVKCDVRIEAGSCWRCSVANADPHVKISRHLPCQRTLEGKILSLWSDALVRSTSLVLPTRFEGYEKSERERKKMKKKDY